MNKPICANCKHFALDAHSPRDSRCKAKTELHLVTGEEYFPLCDFMRSPFSGPCKEQGLFYEPAEQN